MANSLISIEGFEELNEKLKKLDDSVKRTEVLKIQRRLMKPVAEAYSRKLPVDSGNLSRSVRIKTVSKRASEGNPGVQVLPDKNSKADGWYRFMVVRKGFKGYGRGSRKGANTVVTEARNKAINETKGPVIAEAQKKTAEYIQKQINRLSTKFNI